MSQVCISYSSLNDASSEAGQVAKKLDIYASNLDSQIYKKLCNYGGSYTTNIAQAKSNVSAKISDLRTRSNAYSRYSQDLLDLKDQCVSTDKAVKSNVSKLTASFKSANGIRDSKVLNAINYFLTSIGNKTSVGRWMGNKKDEASAALNNLKDSIKAWYNYEGGKELITGVLIGLFEVAIGVLTIFGAFLSILSGGALLVIIAGIVGGLIVFANGIANIMNEHKAYLTTQNGDPATGRRRSEVNTWQDYLRSSFAFGDNGENYEYDKLKNGLATGIDIVNLACAVVTLLSSAGKLLKNGYKWATGDASKIKDIRLKQIFSKEAFAAFKGKFTDIKAAFRANGWETFKDLGERILKDFGRNFKTEFWNFENTNGSTNWEGAVSSIKNMISVPKDILKGGPTLSNIFSVGFSNIVLPSLTAFTINSSDATIINGGGGQLKFDFTDKVNVKTIVGVGEKLINIGNSSNNLFFSDSVLSQNVLSKLSLSGNINISIPEVYIPDIEIPILRSMA